MKVTLAQLDYVVGDIEGNKEKIIAVAQQSAGSSLVVFAEMALCGCPSYGLLQYDWFIDKCEKALDEIASRCDNIPILVGAPIRNNSGKGKPLFNAAVYMFQGQRKVFKKKQLGISDRYEAEYFEPSDENDILKVGCHKFAITIGDDMCNNSGDDILISNRVDELMPQQPDLIVNIAADRFICQHAEQRRNVLRQTVLKYERPLIYVNQVGASTDYIYDGGSMVFGYNAYVVDSLPFFETVVKNVPMELLISMKRSDNQEIPSKYESLYNALILGIRDFFQKQGFSKAVLGLSGGIDSALVMTLAAAALGNENVTAILLPSEYSTGHSVSDAEALAKNLGSPYYIIPIKDSFHTLQDTLSPVFKGLPFDVTEENLQARIRAVILMAYSNKFGNILLNTSNKSEAAVGYGTLYGDMCGSLSVIGDVYKTDVFGLSRWINRESEIIPWHTIEKVPSAELRPDQKDTDSLPDYPVLDAILYQYVESSQSPDAIVAQGFDSALVNKVIRLVNANEFKRKQVAPILSVSYKPFSRRLMPIGRFVV